MVRQSTPHRVEADVGVKALGTRRHSASEYAEFFRRTHASRETRRRPDATFARSGRRAGRVPAGKASSSTRGEREGAFECNICLRAWNAEWDAVRVHPYCWPCIYKYVPAREAGGAVGFRG